MNYNSYKYLLNSRVRFNSIYCNDPTIYRVVAVIRTLDNISYNLQDSQRATILLNNVPEYELIYVTEEELEETEFKI